MDMSQLSDEELDAIIGEQTNDVTQLSDEELDAVISEGDSSGEIQKEVADSERGSILNPLLEGLTLKWGDEAAAALGAAYGVGMPESMGGMPDNVTFDEAYKGIKGIINEDTEAFSKRNPKTALGAEILGAVGTGGAGLARFGASAASKAVAPRILQNTAVGAAEGGIAGAGGAEGMDDLAEETLKGAGLGAAGGAVGGEILNYLTKRYRDEDDIIELLTDGWSGEYVKDKTKELERMIRIGADPEDIKALDFEIKDAIRGSKANALGATEDIKALPEQTLTDWTKKRFGDESFIHKAQKKIIPPRQRVVVNEIAKDAEDAGFARDVIAPLRQLSSKADAQRQRKILNHREHVQNNKYEGIKQRPSSFLGDDFLTRINYVRDINKKEGVKLGDTIRGLKGKSIDFSDPLNKFKQQLEDMDVDFDKISAGDFEEGFKRSTVEGLARYENAIKRVIKRVTDLENPTALDLHKLKVYMDQNVSHDKAMGGLGGQIDRSFKDFRYNINKLLQDKFPEYKKQNKIYSETIHALKDVEKATGGKSEWQGANEALGTELRKIFTNYASRVPLMESLKNLETVARKNGADFKDDLFLNTMFANELDERFGSVASGSLKGIMESTGKTSVNDLLKGFDSMEVLEKGIDYVTEQAPTDKEAFEAMRKLIDNY